MKLTTPAIASVPYVDEAPSVSTSMRSSAAIGSVFRSTATAEKGLGTTRLPFSSTSVRCAPRLRRDAYEAAPLPWLTEPELTRPAPPCVTSFSACSALVTPALRSSSTVIVVVGRAVSPSIRRSSEPVISTRSSDCAPLAWASAFGAKPMRPLPRAALTARLIFFALTMSPLLRTGSIRYPEAWPEGHADCFNGCKGWNAQSAHEIRDQRRPTRQRSGHQMHELRRRSSPPEARKSNCV